MVMVIWRQDMVIWRMWLYGGSRDKIPLGQNSIVVIIEVIRNDVNRRDRGAGYSELVPKSGNGERESVFFLIGIHPMQG